MPDEPENVEKPTPTECKPDRLELEQTITTTDQNAALKAALAANPNEFHSMSELPALGPRQSVEAFQLVDGDATIAAAKKKSAPAPAPVDGNSFHEGLMALPASATDQDRVAYQIDYITRKSGEQGLLLKTGITENQNNEPPKLYDDVVKALQKYVQDQKERAIGSAIGTVQGIGNVAMDIAWVADFGAALILGNNERAGAMGAQLGESVGSAIVSGVLLFRAADQYLYEVGLEGDYSKPFKDIAAAGFALNDWWQQLPGPEQERRKSEIIAELIAGGFIGEAGGRVLGKAGKFTELLDEIAAHAIGKTATGSKKLIKTLAGHIDDMVQSEVNVAGVGKMKMKDINAVKEDFALKMEGQKPSKAYRGDDKFKSKLSDIGRPKSHINEHGDLVPADLKGVFNGKPVDVVDHVCGYYYDQAKSHSPFTSLTFKDGFEVKFGNEKITVDLDALREAIRKGELKGREQN